MKYIFIFFIILSSCSSKYNIENLKKLGTKNFEKKIWNDASNTEKATMIYSFVKTNKNLTTTKVIEMLGKPTGYYDYDSYPAYFIGDKSVKSDYGVGYLIAFVPNNDNKIIDIIIIPKVN